jgi:hypothetical protein
MTGKHWRRKNSDRSYEREKLKLGRMMALLGGQNRRQRNSGRQSLWAAPAREQPRKQWRTGAHKRTETPHLTSTIILKSKEGMTQSDAKISFSLNSIKNPYNHGGLRPPSLF